MNKSRRQDDATLPILSLEPGMVALLRSHSTEMNQPHKLLGAIAGLAIGAGFSVAGSYLQEELQLETAVWYSPAWQCFTGLAAYALFFCCVRFSAQGDEKEDSSNRHPMALELCYILGVFLGVGGACTAMDLVILSPSLRGAVHIVAYAALGVWLLSMAYGVRSGEHEETPSSTKPLIVV